MPNRILRDYTDSEIVDKLSWQAEVLFIRLMMKADDYGSFHANPKLVKSLLFPLRSSSIRDTDITRWIAECEASGLLIIYTSGQKDYMRIINFNQRLRNMRNKFPDPPADKSPQVAANCRKSQPELETETETEDEDEEEPPASKIFGSDTIMSVDSLMEDCLKDKIYFVEYISRNFNVNPQQLSILMKSFNDMLKSTGESIKSKKDYRRHFQNWLRKQPLSTKPKMKQI